MCPHPDTIHRKAQQLGQEHDREVFKRKNENESSQRKSEILDLIETSLKDTMYLGLQPPICEFKDVILQKKAGKEMCLAVPDRLENEITTLDVSCLQLVCRVTTPYEVVQNLFQNQATVYSVEEVMGCFETVVAVAIVEGVCHPIEACNIAKKKVEENIPGYQIIGDNLDLHINVKHMSNALDRCECFLKVICNICHDASRNLGLILRFSQSLSTLPQNTITFPPQKIFYQLKAHFCLTLLSQFLLICDKGSRINYVFNLASDSYRDTGPFSSGRSQCHKLDRS